MRKDYPHCTPDPSISAQIPLNISINVDEWLIVPVLCWLICLFLRSVNGSFFAIPISFTQSKDVHSILKIILSVDLYEVVDYISAIHWLPIFDDSAICQSIRSFFP
jgi:hypothetical protein